MRQWTRREWLEQALLLAASGALLPRFLSAQPPAGGAPAPTAAPPLPEPLFRELRGNVGAFTQSGGTIGFYLGQSGAAVVDAQMPESARVFLDGFKQRTNRPLDLLVNTHHHFDHTGGNPVLRPVVTSIVAHANVPELQRRAARERNLGDQVLADTTFTDTLRRDLGEEVLELRYWGPAHTGGDLTAQFERASVVHVGDLVFNRLYPVIDRPGGASIANWIVALEKFADYYPSDTLYIFGHARPEFPVTGNRADVLYHRDYLSALLETARKELAQGKRVEEITARESLPGFPDHVGRGARLSLAENLRIACAELAERQP